MIKLIATDLDGTFLDGNGDYDKERLSVILECFEHYNVHFTVASGRPFLALERFFADFMDKIMMIAENGCAVIEKGNLAFEEHLTKEQFLEIVSLLQNNPFSQKHEYLLSGKKAAYIHKDASKEYENYISQFYEPIIRVKDFSVVDDLIFNIIVNFQDKILSKANEWINQEIPYVTAITTGFGIANIVIKGLSKRTGLEYICKQLDIKPEEVLVFGDNLNDYEMFEFAGTKIAPENSRKQLKAIASEVIASHETASVMTYLENICKDLEKNDKKSTIRA